jgi:hypothetical protein
MKQTKMIAITAAAVLLTSSAIYADDTALDSFDSPDTSSTTASSAPAVTIGGEGKLDARYYVDSDQDSSAETPVSATPSAKIDFKFESSKADIEAKFAVSEDIVKNYQRGIIDELTMRAYLGDFTLEAGDMKIVWGKGDKLHVIDNFNANDYTDFLIPDYIERRIAEPMFHVAWNCPKDFAVHSFRIEGVYTPLMTADRFATSGKWVPANYTSLAAAVTNVEEAVLAKSFTTYNTTSAAYTTLASLAAEYSAAANLYSTYGSTYQAQYTATKAAYDAALANAGYTTADESTAVASAKSAFSSAALSYMTTLSEVSSFSSDSLYPDTYLLKYGQAGARMTGTIGMVDLGLSYYYGHYKQPSVNWNNYIASAAANSGTSYELPSLAYDKLQVFGAEAGSSLGPVNLRGEFGYYLTDDTSGDDPWVHNNSVNWLAGFDYNIPINNMNINVQTIGQYILNKDKIEDGKYKTYDIDYNEDGIYTNNKIVVNLSDSWNHEKIKPECSVIWGIEHEDLIIMPKLTLNLFGGCDLITSGMYITNFDSAEKSEFSTYQNNSFVQMSVKYKF